MSAQIDLIYDRLIAEEKLEDGTKYERPPRSRSVSSPGRPPARLATARRLRGRHQIDAVVGDQHRRTLIETKDYDKVIDLPIIRNFWGVVEDIGPDGAFVVTTMGFT